MRRIWPIRIWDGLLMPFRSAIALTVVPKRAAMADRVSPAWTRYVRNDAPGVGDADVGLPEGDAATEGVGDGARSLGVGDGAMTDGDGEAGGETGGPEAGDAAAVSPGPLAERARMRIPKAAPTRTTSPAWPSRPGPATRAPSRGPGSRTSGVVPAYCQRLVRRAHSTDGAPASGSSGAAPGNPPSAARKVAQDR